MNSSVKENKMLSPYFLFFLISAAQTGIVMLTFQTKIIKGAGHNSWLSVLVLGLVMHVIFIMMLYILKQSSGGDILSFHRDVFGKFFGGIVNIILAIYFLNVSLFSIYSYIDILQIWVFDGILSWEFSILLIILIFYIVVGGFRIIAAIAYFGVIIPSLILLIFLYLFNYIELSYLQPIFLHGVKDHLISAREAVPLFLGFENVLIYFPFIKNREKAPKWGHLGLLFTTIMYTSIAILTFLFFTMGKLNRLTWPTLTMVKIIQFPFIERFEFIFIFTWLLSVIAGACIYLWSAIRSIKLTIPKIKSTHLLIFLLGIFLFINSFLIDLQFSFLWSKIYMHTGHILLFGYIPLLFIIALIKGKLAKK
ncbi:GerAB/ArcD/ProY family transporter [Niallia sp. Krafla_26]|uniref:GerAB/ArcD/ProY family transporter n=1 Tax=Niallia sp. Krafla_26 TaxID=3064703 RepID=UPI003D17CCE8